MANAMMTIRKRVYPRVCGGTFVGEPVKRAVAGLSPRVRGNLHGLHQRLAGDGSIPACAGEPTGRRSRSRRTAVYPRVCGGTPTAVSKATCSVGLSPRVRGNPEGVAEATRGMRSIPACAGEPLRNWLGVGEIEVYPRVCGGTSLPQTIMRSRQGLSPRVRGNRSAMALARA